MLTRAVKDLQALFLLSQAGTSGTESLSLLPQDFSELPERPEFAFAELTPAQTTYLTHGYHRYPAKFIPQLARKLIEQYSQPGDWVLDSMAGSYTACVEALLAGRRAVGVDINPVAHLIGKAKTTPLDPSQLDRFLTAILRRAGRTDLSLSLPTPPGQGWQIPEVSRLDSWHPPEIKAQLAQLLSAIQPLPEDYRDFFLCAFSHVLKSCSWWSMKSTKPIHVYEKTIPNPIATFRRHAELMIRRHREYREQLPPQIVQEFPQWCQLHCADARSLPLADESVSLVVTSPPYVTSYEYADLHQLSALWL
ncbi:MAG: hypothetical protein HYX89_04620 [Chloroflexi bacterium]|nr:hypothetical protein [Chloroflexota bacterium]